MAKIGEMLKDVKEAVEEIPVPEIDLVKEEKHTVFGKIDQKILDAREKREDKKAKKAEAKAAKKAEKEEASKEKSTTKKVITGAAIGGAAAAIVGGVLYACATRVTEESAGTEETLVEESSEGICGCEASEASASPDVET